MAINVSDYKRAGIFIEEINNSVIDTPAPQEAVVNFVPGFSKKGTVFNRPVYVKNPQDRFRFFGDIDRNLEKKGSFFHRTIDVCTQTGPVWAMNLLRTTSLDQLNYKSVAVAAQYDNLPVLNRQYDDFFNKAGFWQRDTESFLFFANNNQQMVHFTNLGDSKSTIFMFKSPAAGFNLTAEVWYGSAAKVPTWMSRYDLISDYIVRVVIVKGDYSNYVTLAADPYWSKYFAASGIRKSMVDDFTRDRAVSTLGVYDCSLIPFFRDANNRNIFIESVINNDTDRTGIFCAFDIDKVETDFPNGRVDIIGQTLVDLDKSKIDFMSYQDTIQEIDQYGNILLDQLGNSIAIGAPTVGPTGARKGIFTNGLVTGLTITSVFNTTTPSTLITPILTYTATSATAIINNSLLNLSTVSLTFAALSAPTVVGSNYRYDAVYLDQNGVVTIAPGTATFNAVTNITINPITEALSSPIPGLTKPASMPNNAIVYGYVFREAQLGGTFNNIYVPVAIDDAGYIGLTIGTSLTNDVFVAATPNNVLNITFQNTALQTKSNYRAWRRILFFNELVTKKILSLSTIIDNSGNKVDLTSAVWVDNFTSGSGDKNIVLTVSTGINIRSASAAGAFTFYFTDFEFGIQSPFTSGALAGIETRNGVTGTANYGVVAKQSRMYLDFYNGRINTGDYFFTKIANTTSFKWVHYTNTANPLSVGDWIIMSATDKAALGLVDGSNNLNILVQTHPVNTGNFLLSDGFDHNPLAVNNTFTEFGLQNDGFLLLTEFAVKVNTLVTTYTTPIPTEVYDFNQKLYLKMYTIGSTMKVDFMSDNTLITPGTIPAGLVSINDQLNVYSGEAAYTQTLEIETHPNYTITDTKFLIDLVRYPEVKVGDFIKAFIDPLALNVGEYPKKFSRIIKKAPWVNNALYNVQYAEITCDVKVDIENYSGDLQTTRYTTIEDYVDTYKAITLGGFVTQATSWPDGTEARQSSILDIVIKDSPLYNAIVNKNKFNFRYLVDSFGLGLTPFSKQQLADITGKRKNTIGFLNMPSAKAFKQSSSPSFINTDGTLNTEYIKDGGNLAQNPPFLYSFAQGSGKDDGRDTVGYFFPYVTVDDGGRPLSFPPASYVMNTYMRKVNSVVTGTYPWTIAAGINDGRILGIANTEMDFTEKDYENFYAMGANPLSYAKNVGFYIETEWTASVTPRSSLSFLHCREVLIDLENDLFAMLLKYQWKFNTPQIRAKIKREADEICQRYVDRSGLTAFENIIDENNNTPILIDNQIGLLETKVEIVKGLAIVVNQINVLATGALAGSSGFSQQ